MLFDGLLFIRILVVRTLGSFQQQEKFDLNAHNGHLILADEAE